MKATWYISGKPLKNLISGKVVSEVQVLVISNRLLRGTLVAVIHPVIRFNLLSIVACIIISGMWL